jgi:hypothetical protein|tara:strand:+ start:645 stop:1160 length:516 start_codon:yes stop_codon:yes gene_type:complete
LLVHTILGECLGIFKEKAMKLPINTFFTLLVIAFAGSSTAQGEDDRNLQAEDVFHSFLSAFTNSDVDGIVNLFSENAIFWGTGSAELVEDTAGIRLYFSGLSKRPPGQALARAQNFSIMELSNDSVLISGMWEVVPQGQKTGTPLRISMALSLQDGVWKIVQFHNSAMPGS